MLLDVAIGIYKLMFFALVLFYNFLFESSAEGLFSTDLRHDLYFKWLSMASVVEVVPHMSFVFAYSSPIDFLYPLVSSY